jgi:Fungal cellulose binding domain
MRTLTHLIQTDVYIVQGWGGNGRWPLTWQFIDCPATDLRFSTQGSNNFYGKMKVEAGGPVSSVTCNGIPAQMTPDGFAQWNDGSGSLGCGPTCTITFSNGKSVTKQVDGGLFGGGCNGKAPAVNVVDANTNAVQAPAVVVAIPVIAPKPVPVPPAPVAPAAPVMPAVVAAPAQCAAITRQCDGKEFKGAKCCAQAGAQCVWVNEWWSECKWPPAKPAAAVPAVVAPKVAPSSSNSCANGSGILSDDKQTCCAKACGACE